jgi:hypothetical protein
VKQAARQAICADESANMNIERWVIRKSLVHEVHHLNMMRVCVAMVRAVTCGDSYRNRW